MIRKLKCREITPCQLEPVSMIGPTKDVSGCAGPAECEPMLVAVRSIDGARILSMMKWGLIPHWSCNQQNPSSTTPIVQLTSADTPSSRVLKTARLRGVEEFSTKFPQVRP